MRHAVLGTGIFLALLGCSSSSSSSSSASDAGADAATEVKVDSVANWSCVGKVKTPAPVAASVAQDIAMLNPVDVKGIAGVVVKTCDRTDTTCSAPHETQTTDETGHVKFAALPLGTAGFDGYFEARAGTDGLVNLNFQEPIFNTFANYNRIYWDSSQLAALLSAGDIKADLTSRGGIGFQVNDCTSMPGGVSCRDKASCSGYLPGGVTAELDVKDPGIVRGFIRYENGTATVSTKETSTSALVGLGGFFNVPPGPVTVTLKVEATGQVVAVYKILVRAGALSNISAPPTN